jgi:thioredoxin reductase
MNNLQINYMNTKIHDTCIIGGGISGIYSLKYCLENNIKDVILFEKENNIGGIWNFNNKPGGVLKDTFASSSLFYLHPSDFPFPDNTPLFPHNLIVQEHLINYINHFNLKKYIEYNTEILSISKIPTQNTQINTAFNIEEKNIWKVSIKNNIQTEVYYFKKIIIATGTAQYPNPIPSIFKNFTGEIYHSHYFNDKKYTKKKILIVGGGETASDIAVQLCNDNSIYMSVYNGVWFQDRIFGADFPTDMLYNRFVYNCFSKSFINYVIGTNVEKIWGVCGSGVDIWKVKESGFLNSFYNKCRDVIHMISKGKVIPKKKIIEIKNKLVTFDDNSTTNFDIIITAIGYNLQFPFLNNNYNFDYLHIFDPTDTSICFIGGIRPYVASIPMLIEFQAELIGLYYSNKIKLPTYNSMIKDINQSKLNQFKEFKKDYVRLNRIVDPFTYANKITKVTKTKPNPLYLLFSNPYLWFQYIFNPYTLFSYRLTHCNKIKKNIALMYMNKYHNTEVAIRAREISYFLLCLFYIFPFLFICSFLLFF